MNRIFSLVCEFCFCIYFLCLILLKNPISHQDITILIALGFYSIINSVRR